MQTLLSQLLRFDILVTGIVSSVLTAPSREFYWRYKGTAAARRQPSCSVAGRWRLAWRCETWEEATEAEEGTIWNSFIKRYEKKCCLGHTYDLVLSTERNHVEEDGGKNTLQRKESKLIWRPKIKTGILFYPLLAIPLALGIGQSLLFPLLPIKRYQTRSIQVKSLSLSHVVLKW